MPSIESRHSGARVALPRPVERALHRLGEDISASRRIRRLSQEDLAQRIGTSLSTVRRMEDGYPGTALHTFLRALQVLGNLEALVKIMAIEKDVLGMELVREQLPKRVRTSHRSKPLTAPAEADKKDTRNDHTDELTGF